MVYSTWKMLFSILNDMVSSNPQATYEKQWNLLHDMTVLSKPHVLKEEGFPVIFAKSFTGASQRGLYIFSLSDLEIGRPYVTRGDTCIVRPTAQEVQLGEIYSSKSKNGVVTLKIPSKEELKCPFYRPTLSGVLMGEIMLLALEQFTKKNLKQGVFFYEYINGDLQFGRCIKDLQELSPNVTYVSEDNSVKIKRRSGGRFSFYFAGYINSEKQVQDATQEEEIEEEVDFVPQQEPLPTYDVPVPEEIILKEQIESELSAEFSPLVEDEEIDDMINKLQIESNIPIPPPPPCAIPPPPLMKTRNPETPNKKKMRPLRWSAIPRHQLQATIWGQERSPTSLNSSVISVKERDIERLFSISPVNSPAKHVGSRTVVKKKSLLPLKRANNISIVLSRLPSIQEIRDAILLESDMRLSLDQLNSLDGILPIAEDDVTAVVSSKRNPEDMSNAELFVYELSNVSRLHEKIRCLQFMILLDEDYNVIMPQIQCVIQACKEAKASKGLRRVLKLILEIGSILNRDTYLSSNGFRLQSLTNIAETKAKCGSVTLVHYLSQLIAEQDPDVLNFEEKEMPHCSKASQISMDAIITQVKEITQHMQAIETELKEIQSDKENARQIYERFAVSLATFHKEARQQVKTMQQETAALRKIFNEVGTYFGEDPSEVSTNSAEFFTIIHQFSNLLQATQNDNRATKLIQQLVETPSPVSSPKSSVVDVSQTC